MSAPTPEADSQRLDSWKQIAAYLGMSERTVRRWHQLEGLPVHKLPHQQRQSVWAFRHEIDAWLENRKLTPTPLSAAPEPARQPYWMWATAAALILIGTAATVWWFSIPPAPLPWNPVPLTTYKGVEYGVTFSPDNQQMAFYKGATPPAISGIYLRPIDSETPSLLSTWQQGDWKPGAAFIFDPSWSPDGKSIAYQHRTTKETWLHVITPSGTAGRPVAKISDNFPFTANNRHLSWSADSQWIYAPLYLADARRGIFRISAATGTLHRITDPGNRVDLSPILSFDGRHLAFFRRDSRNPDQDVDLMMIELSPNGLPLSAPTTVLRSNLMPSGLAWTPSGKDIIFCAADIFHLAPLNSRLFRVRAAAGAQPTPLGSGDCITVTVTRPDSSGKSSLVYGASSANSAATLWSTPLSDLSQSRQFAPSTRFDVAPVISPNRQHVSFVSNRSGAPEIWIAPFDGSTAQRLTNGANPRSTAQWSADGNHLVFSAGGKLFTIPVTGGQPRHLPLPRPVENPTWSHDGRLLYFSSGGQIWKADKDGGAPVKIEGPQSVYKFVESFDGQRLFYTTGTSQFTLYSVPAAGGTPVVWQTGLRLASIAVSRKFVYFTDAHFNITRLPIDGGNAEMLGRPATSQSDWGMVARFGIAVSSDDERIFFSQPGPQEVDLLIVRDFR